MKNANEQTKGIWYVVGAYLLWGFLPLYWKPLQTVSALEILAHRIVWSFVFMICILMITGKINAFFTNLKGLFRTRTYFLSVFTSSLLISSNWLIYIWAVNTGHVVEASLGYYLNPLLNVLLGIIFLNETLNRWQVISFFFALIGSGILAIQHGQVPWIALSLALTFALYGLTKKLSHYDALIGLTYETMFVAPPALLLLMYQYANGTSSFGVESFSITLLLMGAGAVTALPLLFFAQGTKRITFTMVGFLQYIAPTIMLFLGVFVFKEGFSTVQLISFLFIWVALILFSFSKATFMLKAFPKKSH